MFEKELNVYCKTVVDTIQDGVMIVNTEGRIVSINRAFETITGYGPEEVIGASASMQQVFDLVSNASMSEAPIIICGESGTGKELVAKAIHEVGVRKDKPFIKVNCAALNESLLESELFGHVKGAFTGAHKSREGRFEAARGGDIFLDEIGDLPLSTQVKLLRVLEEKVVERVGDNQPIHTDVRIVSATNQDLRQLVKRGSFREDCYYRINVIPIYVPPLRERIGDIPILAASFFRRLKIKSEKAIKELSPEALSFLIQYSWPGNVRELKSAFEYAFVSCNGEAILPQHLPTELIKGWSDNKIERSSSESLEGIKKQRLMDALRKSGGNQSKAARILGISRTSVWNQVRKFNIKI